MIDPTILYSLLGAFALLFAMSALEKYQDLETFGQLLDDYRLLPQSLLSPVVRIIFLGEVTTATLLLTPAYVWGVGLAFMFLLTYTAAVGINVARGRTHIDCGCLGTSGEGIGAWHLVRNAGLLCLLALCLLPPASRELAWLDFTTIIFFLVAATLSYGCINLMIGHHYQQRLWWN